MIRVHYCQEVALEVCSLRHTRGCIKAPWTNFGSICQVVNKIRCVDKDESDVSGAPAYLGLIRFLPVRTYQRRCFSILY